MKIHAYKLNEVRCTTSITKQRHESTLPGHKYSGVTDVDRMSTMTASKAQGQEGRQRVGRENMAKKAGNGDGDKGEREAKENKEGEEGEVKHSDGTVEENERKKTTSERRGEKMTEANKSPASHRAPSLPSVRDGRYRRRRLKISSFPSVPCQIRRTSSSFSSRFAFQPLSQTGCERSDRLPRESNRRATRGQRRRLRGRRIHGSECVRVVFCAYMPACLCVRACTSMFYNRL